MSKTGSERLETRDFISVGIFSLIYAVVAFVVGGVAQMTPGLTFQPVGQSSITPPVMRGMTANIVGFSSAVALLVDGVPTLRGQGFGDSLLGEG